MKCYVILINSWIKFFCIASILFQPEMRENFDKMKLFPEKFIDYLLSDDIGFKSAEQMEMENQHDKEG